MAGLKKKPTRDDIIGYVQDVVTNGYTKKDAFQKNIDNSIVDVTKAVIRLEKSEDFQAVYGVIMDDDTMRLNKKVKVIQGKYADLIEKNIDTASAILDKVKGGEVKDQAIAVRLVNETVGAMAIVNGPAQAQQPGSLNKANAVQ